MAMNRDKFRNIVGGITTPAPEAPSVQPPAPEEPASPVIATTHTEKPSEVVEQGPSVAENNDRSDKAGAGDSRRFAKRGRPKGSKTEAAAGPTRKVKVSLFLSESIVNDLYEWAHADRMHPGEMFEAALKPFHEREAKRRKGGRG